MNTHYKQSLNHFFVETFNKILSWEEVALSRQTLKDLSVRELHILEAVKELEKKDLNTMSQIAERLSISVGALTTAVNVLVNKGYLIRKGRESDRRVVLIHLTEKGLSAEAHHHKFHDEMVEDVIKSLDDNSLKTLISSLEVLSTFFENKVKTVKKENRK